MIHVNSSSVLLNKVNAARTKITLRLIPIVKYFSLLTFIVSTVLIIKVYLSPTHTLVDYSIIYGVALSGVTLVFFLIIMLKGYFQKVNRRKLLFSSLWLLINSGITIVYIMIWNYAVNTILAEVINNTGHEITNAGIYGCHEQDWGKMQDGESRTVRFPSNALCAFTVTYQLKGETKVEVLPRKEFIKNIYYLGKNPDTGF